MITICYHKWLLIIRIPWQSYLKLCNAQFNLIKPKINRFFFTNFQLSALNLNPSKVDTFTLEILQCKLLTRYCNDESFPIWIAQAQVAIFNEHLLLRVYRGVPRSSASMWWVHLMIRLMNHSKLNLSNNCQRDSLTESKPESSLWKPFQKAAFHSHQNVGSNLVNYGSFLTFYLVG